jgi:hypothetical protein
MADETKPNASTVQSNRSERSPAKVPDDRDEAKQLPDDVPVNVTRGPDADLHHPAAASSVADTEAGAGAESNGRIEPLKRKDPATRRNGG